MRELARLLRFSRPYTPHLIFSVLLMACVGAAQALTALLIGPIFDRVLNPASAEAPVLLFTIPIFQHKLFLADLMPASIHNVWTMVAVGILAVFFIKGLCDYCANYLINYVGFSAVTDLRQTVFDRVVHQDAHFFEANSTARVMSSIMNDLEKIQVALSHILADWLRQSLHGARAAGRGAADRLEAGDGQPDGAAVRAGADAAAGPAHPPDHAQRAGQRRGIESGAAGDPERPPGGEVLWRGRNRIQPLPRPRRKAAQQQPALCRAAGDRQSGDRVLRRGHHCRAAHLRAAADQSGRDDYRRIHAAS